MNKKTVFILIGVGVLLYLWSKGYFKRKRTPLLVAEPPISDAVAVVEDPNFMDESGAAQIVSPTQTNPEGTPIAYTDEVVDATTYDPMGGDSMNQPISTVASASGMRHFGYVRRPR
jgi:hypothetical protein